MNILNINLINYLYKSLFSIIENLATNRIFGFSSYTLSRQNILNPNPNRIDFNFNIHHWFFIALEDEYKIYGIDILYTDCCAINNEGIYVVLSYVNPGSPDYSEKDTSFCNYLNKEITPGKFDTIFCKNTDIKGKYVVFKSKFTTRGMVVSEIRLFGQKTNNYIHASKNVALEKPGIAFTNFYLTHPTVVLTNGKYHHIFHTDCYGSQWVIVDLLASYAVESMGMIHKETC